MKKQERLEIVRTLLRNRNNMPLEEIARECHVSLRTTYRDLHAIYSHNAQVRLAALK